MDVLEAIECVCANLIKGLKKLRNSSQVLNEAKFQAVLTGLVNSNDKPIVRHMFKNPTDKEITAVFTNLKTLVTPNYFFQRIVQFIRASNSVDELLQ